MSRSLNIILLILALLVAAGLLGGLVWANTRYVRTRPVEKDFLVPWLGARTFLQYGDSPYSGPATQRAQVVYYGRLAGVHEDPLRLWLPMPFELFYFPFALVPDYALARAIWMTCLEIALVALGFLSLRLTDWKPARTLLPFILLFPLFWVYGALPLVNGSGTGFLALALVGALLALHDQKDELAGALLLLAAGAPRIVGIFLFFLIWWLIYHRRWRVFWGFLMSLALLLALSFLLLPNWFLPFLSGVASHASFVRSLSSLEIFASWSPVVGLRLGWVLIVGLLLALFIEWGGTLRKGYRHFAWTIGLSLAVIPLLGIPLATQDFVFLFIPVAVLLGIMAERWSRPRRWGVAGITLLIILAGSWLLAIEMRAVSAYEALPDSLFLVLPVMLTIGLYWMRWWYLSLPHTELETSQ